MSPNFIEELNEKSWDAMLKYLEELPEPERAALARLIGTLTDISDKKADFVPPPQLIWWKIQNDEAEIVNPGDTVEINIQLNPDVIGLLGFALTTTLDSLGSTLGTAEVLLNRWNMFPVGMDARLINRGYGPFPYSMNWVNGKNGYIFPKSTSRNGVFTVRYTDDGTAPTSYLLRVTLYLLRDPASV